jgi:hypothetical protein
VTKIMIPRYLAKSNYNDVRSTKNTAFFKHSRDDDNSNALDKVIEK